MNRDCWRCRRLGDICPVCERRAEGRREADEGDERDAERRFEKQFYREAS